MFPRRLGGASAAALIAAGSILGATPLQARADPSSGEVPVVEPTVLAEVPHDPGAYTEGFEFDGPDTLYEATGEVGKSQLRELDPNTGAVRRSVPLPSNYFGEGITVVGDRIWQLTYKDGVAIEWDKATFTPLREVPVSGQGLGVVPRRRPADPQRRNRPAPLPRPSDLRRDRRRHRHPRRAGRDRPQRTGVRGRSSLGELVAGRRDRPHRPGVGGDQPRRRHVGTVAFGDRSIRQVLSGIAHVGGEEFLVDGKEWPAAFRVRIPGA